jgi:hypothetical protein
VRIFARETAGAASTRHSLLPHFGGKGILAKLGRIVPREGEVMSANADANKFVMPGKDPRQRDVALRITTSFARFSHVVLGRVLAEDALVALQFPFAIRPFGEPIGNSDLCVHRTGTECDARLITGGDDFLKAKLAVAENSDESNEHGDLR